MDEIKRNAIITFYPWRFLQAAFATFIVLMSVYHGSYILALFGIAFATFRLEIEKENK
jgi:hypothetical protein